MCIRQELMDLAVDIVGATYLQLPERTIEQGPPPPKPRSLIAPSIQRKTPV